MANHNTHLSSEQQATGLVLGGAVTGLLAIAAAMVFLVALSPAAQLKAADARESKAVGASPIWQTQVPDDDDDDDDNGRGGMQGPKAGETP